MRLLALVSVLALLVAVTGCGNPPEAPKPPASKKFTLILKAAPADITAGAKGSADKWVTIETVDTRDAAAQVTALKNAAASKVDGVAIDCLPTPEVTQAVAECVKAGVPVVTYNTDCLDTIRNGLESKEVAAANPGRVSFVGSTPAYVGRLLAYEVAKQLGQNGGVVAIISAEGPVYQAMEDAAMAYLANIQGITGKLVIRAPETAEGVTAAITEALQKESAVAGWIVLNPAAIPDAAAAPLAKTKATGKPIVAVLASSEKTLAEVVGTDKVDVLVAPQYAAMGSAVVQILTRMTRNQEYFPYDVVLNPEVMTPANLTRKQEYRKKILSGEAKAPVFARGAPTPGVTGAAEAAPSGTTPPATETKPAETVAPATPPAVETKPAETPSATAAKPAE